MRITSSEEYGLRLAVQLAASFPAPLTLAELAEREGIPQPLVAKVLAKLRRAGVVRARRGRVGGYELTGEPRHISLDRVLGALGQPLFYQGFCHQHGGKQEFCVHTQECSVRPLFFHLDRMFREFFAGTNLADLLAEERALDRKLASTAPLRLPLRPSEPSREERV
ncbi:MAG: Rrf2 family transcriptional regulator [Thermoanaerobaculum sp.]|nr:Rrf2 family transcriptional regulator [Thermoanaerobaculum sp.]MDW7967531.1 Rrf2 family transcriptional regulator [Thermoanaerobaculum sp.]